MPNTLIPLKHARILWDRDKNIVTISDVRDPIGNIKALPQSGGACWSEWQNASEDRGYKMLLETIFELILRENIDPGQVFQELTKITELQVGIFAQEGPTYAPHWE